MDLNTYHIIKNYPNLNHNRLLEIINKSNIKTSDPDLNAINTVFHVLAKCEDFITNPCYDGICIEFDTEHSLPDIVVTAGRIFEEIEIEIRLYRPHNIPGLPYFRTVEIKSFHNQDINQIQDFLQNATR